MTTALIDSRPTASAPSAGGPARVVRIVRLLIANPMTTIVLPWMILGIILLVNIALWLVLKASLAPEDMADANEGIQYSGASTWLFVYMTVVAVQSMNLTFPLALGYGATRREFYLGTSLGFVLLSAMYAIGLTVLSVVEKATGGWGLGGSMFTAIYFGGAEAAWYVKLAIYFFGMLFFFFVGSFFGAVFVRWRGLGITGAFLVIGVIGVAAVAVITLTGRWPAVGQFFADSQALGVAAWLLVPTALSGLVGYLVLRRATPR